LSSKLQELFAFLSGQGRTPARYPQPTAEYPKIIDDLSSAVIVLQYITYNLQNSPIASDTQTSDPLTRLQRIQSEHGCPPLNVATEVNLEDELDEKAFEDALCIMRFFHIVKGWSMFIQHA